MIQSLKDSELRLLKEKEWERKRERPEVASLIIMINIRQHCDCV